MDSIFHLGVAEDINDPEGLNRVRVRVFDIHTSDKDILPTEDLPWALTNQPTTSASISGIGSTPHNIVNGSWCLIIFMDPISKQIPVILGTLAGIPTEVIEFDEYLSNERKYKNSNNRGFVDPENVYPKFFNESDVNRLARNDKIDETIIKTKKNNVIKDLKEAINDNTWSEPETKYNAKYPYNHVTETKSGHIIEFDDTPNCERIHHYHKAGTFREIYPDGQVVEKVVKDNYQIVLGDDYIHVAGNVRVNIEGNANLYVNGNTDTQINGNANLYIKGNSESLIEGNNISTITGNSSINIKNDNVCDNDGNIIGHVDDTGMVLLDKDDKPIGFADPVDRTIFKDITGQIIGNYNIPSSVNIDIKGNVDMKVSGNCKSEIGGNVENIVTGNVDINVKNNTVLGIDGNIIGFVDDTKTTVKDMDGIVIGYVDVDKKTVKDIKSNNPIGTYDENSQVKVNIKGNAELEIDGDYDTYVKGDYNLGVEKDINITSGQKTQIVSDGINIDSSENVDIKGKYINLN